MISSTFFFLFSQLGVGMMLTLLFISPRSIGNSFFKFASLTAAILLGVTLGFNFLFPSPVREGQIPVFLLAGTALLGSVMLTMVFGHWYLVIPKLSIEPLEKLTKVLIGTIGLRILTIV